MRLEQPDSVWSGRFSWEGDTRSFDHFSWLVDYLGCLCDPDDDEVVTHTLLVLSGMRQLGNSTEWQLAYVKRLFSYMGLGQPRHVRHAALRAAHDARSALASIDISGDEALPLINPLLPDEQESFDPKRDLCFLRLVFTLARNRDSGWRPHLVKNNYVKRCVDIIEPSLRWYLHPFYLLGFLLRIAPEEPQVTDEQWKKLIKEAWHAAAVTNVLLIDDDGVEALRPLVKCTTQHMIDGGASKDTLKRLDDHVASALKMLERRKQNLRDPSPETRACTLQNVIFEVEGLKDKVHEALISP